MSRALVLFSGGLDSSTCLAWALTRFEEVETIGFRYGQRHAIEMTCRAKIRAGLAGLNATWADRLGPDHCLDLNAIADIGGSALTEDAAITMTADGLPTTFVPARNLLFFTFGAAVAYRRGLRHLVGGMSEGLYPDCRDDTLKALQVALNLGTTRRFVIETPLMWRSKAATWQLAAYLGGTALIDLIRTETHTCYLGDRSHHHDWG